MARDIDIAKLETGEIKALIENHRNKGATDRPAYIAALRELESRTGRGLDFDKSLSIIKRAAKARQFVSYKDLADESGAEWTKVHYEIGGHLWRLVEYAHRSGWPMLSAIVVNKANLRTGEMDPDTLKGFVTAAHDLGHRVTDARRFLKEQQEAVFRWAIDQP